MQHPGEGAEEGRREGLASSWEDGRRQVIRRTATDGSQLLPTTPRHPSSTKPPRREDGRRLIDQPRGNYTGKVWEHGRQRTWNVTDYNFKDRNYNCMIIFWQQVTSSVPHQRQQHGINRPGTTNVERYSTKASWEQGLNGAATGDHTYGARRARILNAGETT